MKNIAMNLQLLASEGVEPTEGTESQINEGQETPQADVKTFTQEELNKIVEKRLARERKDIEKKIEQERAEAEKLAKMSEAEKAKALFEKEKEEFLAMKREFEAQKMLNETMKQLASKNLPTEFAELLKADDAETTLANINAFETSFNRAVEQMVNSRLKGTAPKTPVSTQAEITKEQFKNMDIMEKQKLLASNPELFAKLSN